MEAFELTIFLSITRPNEESCSSSESESIADEGMGREDIAFLNDVEESSLRYSPLVFRRALLIVFSSSTLSSPAFGEPKILKL